MFTTRRTLLGSGSLAALAILAGCAKQPTGISPIYAAFQAATDLAATAGKLQAYASLPAQGSAACGTNIANCRSLARLTSAAALIPAAQSALKNLIAVSTQLNPSSADLTAATDAMNGAEGALRGVVGPMPPTTSVTLLSELREEAKELENILRNTGPGTAPTPAQWNIVTARMNAAVAAINAAIAAG